MKRYRWLAVIIAFLIVSEFLYILSQKPIGYVRSAYKYHFKKFEESYLKNEYGLGLKHLQLGSWLKIYELNLIYPKIEMLPDNLGENLWPSRKYESEIEYRVEMEDMQSLGGEIDTVKLAKLLYKIGGQLDDGEAKMRLWLLATRLAPEWSYFHMEVVLLYSEKNDKEGAWNALDFCMKFKSPSIDCEEMKRAIHSGKSIESPGNYAQNITDI